MDASGTPDHATCKNRSRRSRSGVRRPGVRSGRFAGGLVTAAALIGAATVTAAPASAAPADPVGPETALNALSADPGAPGEGVPDTFYDPPEDFAASQPGDVLRARPTPIDVAGLDLPVHATTVLYRSTDTHGAPIAVSGAVITPDMPWGGPGPRPLVVIAPGTQGQGDECAPSKRMPSGGSVDNLAQAAPFLSQGDAVAVTDYEGLGTPGMHTYMNRLSQAHTVLDMGRAAKALGAAGVTADSPVALWGYSQGGGAVAAATERVDDYAPDLGVTGAFAGAPPADLAVTTTQVDGSRLSGAMGYAINGLEADYPEILPTVDSMLNERGRQMLRDVATQCTSATEDQYGDISSTEFTASGEPIETLLGTEPIRSVVDAQRIGTQRPDVPVFVVTGDGDDIVPARTVRTMVGEWCALGGAVTFRDYPTPSVAPLVDHVAAMPIAAPEALGWMHDRLAGIPDAGTCNA